MIHYINRNKLYFFNFSPWRMMQIKDFFKVHQENRFICKNLEEVLEKGLDKDNSVVFI